MGRSQDLSVVKNRIFEILQRAVEEFGEKAEAEIADKDYSIASPSNDKTVSVTTNRIKNALKIICPGNISQLKSDVIQHFEKVRLYIQKLR